MTIVDNADFELSVTIRADEENDLVTLLREVAKDIKKGTRAGSLGGCLGVAYFQVTELPRAAELPLERNTQQSGASIAAKKESGK